MKQIALILFVIISQSVHSQIDSRDWLNLKGEIKSLRQNKFKIQEDTLVKESSDKRRFEDVLFMSIGQQLLIDNSYIRFSKSGLIEYWAELDNINDTVQNLNFYYDSKLLPYKIEFIRGKSVTRTVKYDFDNSGNFIGVNIDNINSKILRDNDMKVISETLIRNSDTTKLIYNHQGDGTIDIQMFDRNELVYAMTNKFNQNRDFEFDGRYIYHYTFDKIGNWVTKTGFLDGTPVIKFTREVIYY